MSYKKLYWGRFNRNITTHLGPAGSKWTTENGSRVNDKTMKPVPNLQGLKSCLFPPGQNFGQTFCSVSYAGYAMYKYTISTGQAMMIQYAALSSQAGPYNDWWTKESVKHLVMEGEVNCQWNYDMSDYIMHQFWIPTKPCYYHKNLEYITATADIWTFEFRIPSH